MDKRYQSKTTNSGVKMCYFGKKVAAQHLKVSPHYFFLMKIE